MKEKPKTSKCNELFDINGDLWAGKNRRPVCNFLDHDRVSPATGVTGSRVSVRGPHLARVGQAPIGCLCSWYRLGRRAYNSSTLPLPCPSPATLLVVRLVLPMWCTALPVTVDRAVGSDAFLALTLGTRAPTMHNVPERFYPQ